MHISGKILITFVFGIFPYFTALNKTMNVLSKQGESLKSFTYDNEKIRYEIYRAMNSTEFLGISVRLVTVFYAHVTLITSVI